MDMDKIPLIDLGLFHSGPSPEYSAIVSLVDKACREYGFFRVFNHGVSQELQEAVLQANRGLFGLPLEKKMLLNVARSKKKRGYSGLYHQQLDPEGTPDCKESFYISESSATSCNQYPDEEDVPGFVLVTAEYYRQMIKLSQVIFKLLAKALGLPEDTFDEYSGSDGSFAATEGSTLRLVHYPALNIPVAARPVSCGAHTDFGTITILLQDKNSGLQVQDFQSMTWLSIPPEHGVFVVNIGDLMQRWTNDVYKSAFHRVTLIGDCDRYSIPFFFNGNYEYEIRTLQVASKDQKNGVNGVVETYPPIKVGEHIKRRLIQSHVDLGVPKDGRY